MTKSKTPKKTAATPKPRKPAKTPVEAIEKPEAKQASREALCVFAFRLTEEERNAIHQAAGPAKASKFVRTLTVAAARNDEAAVKAIMKSIQADA
jgi:hypothetical protein